jgi:hypothetical protein
MLDRHASPLLDPASLEPTISIRVDKGVWQVTSTNRRRGVRLLTASALAAATIVGAGGPPALAWLHAGSVTQYPSSGGTWTYGFWNAAVRSYYTVNKSHGSSVSLNGSIARSACTASGQKSIAEKYAVNYPGADDAYYYRTCSPGTDIRSAAASPRVATLDQ